MSRAVLTSSAAGQSFRYGEHDSAELFHEESSWYPLTQPSELPFADALIQDPELQSLVARPGKSYDHLPGIQLPSAPLPRTPFRAVLEARRSRRDATARTNFANLGSVVAAMHGATESLRRSSPSAGALYPLELYLITLNVEGLDPGIYHYNSLRNTIAALDEVNAKDIDDAFIAISSTEVSAFIVITGLFWRSRFKYGRRAYRFVLLEAGHVMQVALLTAEALHLAAVPIGGFYDRRLNSLLRIDGVREAALYAVALGSRVDR